MKKVFYLLPALLLLVGCQTPSATQDVESPDSNQQALGQTESPDVKEGVAQKNVPQSFETLEEIQNFINTEGAKSYIVEKPDGFEAYRYQSDAEPYNFGLDGVSQNIYILTDLSSGQYDGLSRDTSYPFFVETTIPPSCFMQEGCDDSDKIITYYGPFEGRLVNILE